MKGPPNPILQPSKPQIGLNPSPIGPNHSVTSINTMGQKWVAGKGAYSVHFAEYSVTGRRSEMEDAFIADVVFGHSFPKAAREKGKYIIGVNLRGHLGEKSGEKAEFVGISVVAFFFSA